LPLLYSCCSQIVCLYLPQNYVLPWSLHSPGSNIKQFSSTFVFVFQRANSKLSFIFGPYVLCVPYSLVARYQRMSRKYPQNYVRGVPSLCCYTTAVPLPRRQSWKPQVMCACVYTFVFFPKASGPNQESAARRPFPQG
jgi:hypothetical protein